MISGCQVVEHSLVKTGVSRLRSRETSLGDFRRALRELAVIVGIEACRNLVLNDKAYIVPGLGDAGDRYFGT